MKIVFMGTPDFAVASLARLISDKHEIIGVFTNTDKPKGRGHKLAFSPVKELALSHNLEIFQPKTLRNEESFEIIKILNPELIVVAAYGKILPLNILEFPKYGCINLHGSLLPKYRGAAPIQWSVLNGDSVTGVTTMQMAEGIDTGDMLLKQEVEIGENETASELFDRLADVGALLLSKTIFELEKGNLTPIKQIDSNSSYAPPLTKEMTSLDFNRSARELHNKIRGLSDWPCAKAVLQDKYLKIYKSEIVHEELNKGQPNGTIIKNKDFIVACGENTALKLVAVQYDNSKRMSGEDFLRGKRLAENEILT